MRKPRPIVTTLEEIIIARAGEIVTIQYKDSAYGTSHLRIGPELAQMTDQEIVDLYNDGLRTRAAYAAEPYVAIEVPLGSAQIEYHADSDQWTPRGDVLRCEISDTVEDACEPVIGVDGTELSWREFGNMICTHAGWSMRIEFVPDDETHRRPKLVVREPEI